MSRTSGSECPERWRRKNCAIEIAGAESHCEVLHFEVDRGVWPLSSGTPPRGYVQWTYARRRISASGGGFEAESGRIPDLTSNVPRREERRAPGR